MIYRKGQFNFTTTTIFEFPVLSGDFVNFL